MLLWIDQRGTPKRLKRIDGYPRRADSPAAMLRWLQIHGLPPIDAAMSLNHMRWIRYARPESTNAPTPSSSRSTTSPPG